MANNISQAPSPFRSRWGVTSEIRKSGEKGKKSSERSEAISKSRSAVGPMIYRTCVRTGMMVIFLYLSSSLFDFLGVVVALDRRETKQMTNEEKVYATEMLLQGISHRRVAEVLGYSKACITRLFKKLRTGTMKPERETHGRKRKTTAETDRLIIQMVKRNGFNDARNILDQLGTVNVSETTIRSRMRESGVGRI